MQLGYELFLLPSFLRHINKIKFVLRTIAEASYKRKKTCIYHRQKINAVWHG